MSKTHERLAALLWLLLLGCETGKRPSTPAPTAATSGGASSTPSAAGGALTGPDLAPASGGGAVVPDPGGAEPTPSTSGGAPGTTTIDWYEMSRRYERQSLAWDLPNKEMLEELDAAQVPSAVNAWLGDFSSMLGDLVIPLGTPGSAKTVPKDLLLRKYNTPEMSWFLTTPSVKSYEEQLAVARKFLEGTTRWSVALPCEIVPPIGGPNGTKVHCNGVFYTTWFEQVPKSWRGCRAEDVPATRSTPMYGAPGTMRVMHHWTAEMHLAESGQVDKFRLLPAKGPVYTVKQGETATCSDEPHWNPKEPSVKTVTVKPGDPLEDGEMNVYCSAGQRNRWQTAVRFQGKTCWVDTFALTKASAP